MFLTLLGLFQAGTPSVAGMLVQAGMAILVPLAGAWGATALTKANAKVALCVGATIDFLAGERSRAPLWMREAGLEWAYRIFTEPRRLAARYAKDALVFPRILAREWWRRRHPSPAGRGWGAERAA